MWAALKQLGRSGLVVMVDGLVANAQALAAGLAHLPGVTAINEVVFTQVCLRFGSHERTREVTRHLIEEGAVWMSGSRWKDRQVLRISVSNWSTDAADITASVEAVGRAMGKLSDTRG